MLAIAMLIAAALYLYVGRTTSFFFDDWNFILDRRGLTAETLLGPHNDHLTLVPVVVYKLYLAVFGLEGYLPYRLTLLAVHLLNVGLLYTLIRRTTPGAAALALAVALLFLGSAWEDLLWAFELTYLLAIASGLTALLMVHRRDRAGAIAVSIALTVSLASSGLGLAFLIVIAVHILFEPDRVRRVWIFLAPLAAYAVWYAIYGKGNVTRDAVLGASGFIADMVGSAFGGLSGLGIAWGRPLAVAGVIALATVIIWRNRLSAPAAAAIAFPAAFWAMTAVSRVGIAEPTTPRYIYPSAVGILLVAGTLPVRIWTRTAAVAVLWIAVTIGVVSELDSLRRGGIFLRETAKITRSELGALEIARGKVAADFRPDQDRMPQVSAAPYFAAVASFGSPAFDERELEQQPEDARQAADAVLVRALGVSAVRAPAATVPAGRSRDIRVARYTIRRGCVRWRPQATGALEFVIRRSAGIVVTRSSQPTELRLRRFASAFPVAPTMVLDTRGSWILKLPSGRTKRPWHLRVKSDNIVIVCARGG